MPLLHDDKIPFKKFPDLPQSNPLLVVTQLTSEKISSKLVDI